MEKVIFLMSIIIFNLFFSTSCILGLADFSAFSEPQSSTKEKVVKDESNPNDSSNLENNEKIPSDEFDSCTETINVKLRIIDTVEVKDE